MGKVGQFLEGGAGFLEIAITNFTSWLLFIIYYYYYYITTLMNYLLLLISLLLLLLLLLLLSLLFIKPYICDPLIIKWFFSLQLNSKAGNAKSIYLLPA